jgi:DNA helicase HerA-like ATPase
MRTDAKGRGYLNIVRLTDIQDRPKLFSTFMLCLLAEIYEVLPEAGDLDKPRLAIFIDEAHLVFSEASKALMSQLETVIKLIRSKGVGVFFCTQQPTDIPEDVLAQLGLKVQHALRAFTAKDRKNLKLVAENYPLSDYYKTDELLTSLGIGEAMVTGLNEKGVPTPLAHVMLCAPRSRMDILTPDEMDALTGSSAIASKYNETIDRESAFEILTQKLSSAAAVESPAEVPAPVPPKPPVTDSSEKPVPPAAPKTASRRVKEEKSVVEEVADSVVGRQVARTIAREITRGLFGVLGLGKRRS